MKIAVEGCAHGELDKIYETVACLEEQNDIKVDLLIICGDFQAVRNTSELACMAVPPKYQTLNSFYKYYSGEAKAPVLTIFVGGNHEASNYLSELAYGGWVCDNIYYMGNASVIEIGGLRIAGISGIYKGQDYLKGHFEVLPYDDSTKRSVYHVRNLEVFRLKQLKQPIDIFISHDWPRGIQEYGDKAGLLRFKPFFKTDMDSGKLGSRPAEELLFALRPTYWFAAHLHCKFAAIVPHNVDGKITNTHFLALDKCLPHKRFLQVLDIPSKNDACLEIKYDPEWLAILRSTNHLLSVSKNQNYMPGQGCSERWDFTATEQEISDVKILFNDDFKVPLNFEQTAPPENPNSSLNSSNLENYVNPQTTLFCLKLGVDDPMQLLVSGLEKNSGKQFSFTEDLNITNISESSFNPDQSSEVLNGDDVPSDGEDFSGFYIDKKGWQDESVTSPLALSPISASTPLKITYDFPEFKEENQNEKNELDDSTSPRPFKMKRRNQSFYATEKDEEEET